MKIFILIALQSLFYFSCAENLAEGTVDASKEERAKKALNDFEWDTAIELYNELIAEQPESYGFYSLIATAYAGRAGVDILNIASNKVSGEGSMIAKVSEYVPADPTDEQLGDIDSSVSQLEAVPTDAVADNLKLSVTTQLSVYLVAQSTMIINSFSSLTPTGQLDPETLDQMTPEDATAILGSLQSAAETTDDPKLKAKIEGVLLEIDTAEGGTEEDRLKSYLQTQQGS